MPTDGLQIDLLLGAAAVATLVMLGRSWSAFWDADFSAADRRLATQLAVFVVPPLIVAAHEGGHVLAAAVIGVPVVGFHFGFFEGSVTVEGAMGPGANWFLALSGSVVGAAAGLALVAVGDLGRRLRPALRHLLMVGGLLAVLSNLVLYPVLSLGDRAGDWVGVYDLSATPVLSTATAVVHAAALIGLSRWWRRSAEPTLAALSLRGDLPPPDQDRSPGGPEGEVPTQPV